ncbi:MAG: HDOD domain-containing protein [Myxococcota bacterium]|jgi:HD-like signal output (HDOD) protein|nr:HDOD domain-containing protein [Myxococcota bacterium]
MLGWLKKKDRDPKRALRESLGDYKLPSFPKVAHEVLRSLRDPAASSERISDRLAEDPGLSAKLLSVASSSAFSLRHPVGNVGHAVTLLGRSTVESLVLAAVVQRTVAAGAPREMDMRAFWRRAARRAAASRALADLLHPTTRAETFTASLLADMAVPLLGKAHGGRYVAVYTQWCNDGGELAEMEREALDVDHASVAGWVARAWELPGVIVDAIGSHHDDDAAERSGVLPSVALAADLGEDAVELLDRAVETVGERWGIGHDVVREAIRKGLEKADDMAARLS